MHFHLAFLRLISKKDKAQAEERLICLPSGESLIKILGSYCQKNNWHTKKCNFRSSCVIKTTLTNCFSQDGKIDFVFLRSDGGVRKILCHWESEGGVLKCLLDKGSRRACFIMIKVSFLAWQSVTQTPLDPLLATLTLLTRQRLETRGEDTSREQNRNHGNEISN